jgi:hypothetical protein
VVIGRGYTEFAGFPVVHQKTTGLIHKAKTEELKTEMQQQQTGLTGEEHKSYLCATTQSGDFEEKDTRRDRKACVEAKQVCVGWASVRWSDDKDFRIHPRGACIPN